MNELALFAGAGGGILGGKLLGWTTVCAVEWDSYARDVLLARQNDGSLEAFPIWDDVQTFDGYGWRGRVDVVSGGFPCQDISAAGKGAGIDGERSGMWAHMARIVREVEPRYVFVENSSMLTSRGLGRVLGDLAALGYDARWGVLGAVDAGAPHKRDRIWIVANAKHSRYSDTVCGVDEKEVGLQSKDRTGRGGSWMPVRTGGVVEERTTDRLCDEKYMANTNSTYGERNKCAQRSEQERADTNKPSWWEVEPDLGRVAHGVAARVDRLRCIGNGQVPAVAALAWRLLS